MGGGSRTSTIAQLLGCLLSLQATSGSHADESLKLWTKELGTIESLQLLAGPSVRIEWCDLSDEANLRKLSGLSGLTSVRATIVVDRKLLDPILAERLRNQGHTLLFLDADGPSERVPAPHTRLRTLCTLLEGCFPHRAHHFQRRLAVLQAELRNRIRQRPVGYPPEVVRLTEDRGRPLG